MTNNRAICYACRKSCELTKEHIIPQAIGGRLKVGLYCEKCNTTFGRKLDDEVSKRFGHFATILDIKRERGTNQPFEVEEIKDGIRLVSDGKSFRRKDPIVRIEIEKDGETLKSADVIARSEDELKRIMTSLEKKYKTKYKSKTFMEHHPGPTETKHDFIFDTKLIRRCVAKIAYSFLCHKLPKSMVLSPSFDEVQSYIINGDGNDLSSANFVHTTFMTDYIRPLHKIHIGLNRQENLVVGYVMFFGTFRYTILLSRDFISRFEWPCLDYTIDPITSKQIEGNPNFRAPSIKEQDILKPKQSKQYVLEEIYKGHKILQNYVDGYEIQKIEVEN